MILIRKLVLLGARVPIIRILTLQRKFVFHVIFHAVVHVVEIGLFNVQLVQLDQIG